MTTPASNRRAPPSASENAATARQEYTPSASSKVFALPELLEQIVIQLARGYVEGGQPSLRFTFPYAEKCKARLARPLYVLQRVDCTFKATIQRSADLRKWIFLDEKDSRAPKLHKSPATVIDCLPIELLIVEAGLANVHRHNYLPPAPGKELDFDVDTTYSNNIADHFRCRLGLVHYVRVFHKTEAAWRKLMIWTRRGVSRITVHIPIFYWNWDSMEDVEYTAKRASGEVVPWPTFGEFWQQYNCIIARRSEAEHLEARKAWR